MKLYRIFQTVNNDYDTFDSAIVCAESEEDARSIEPRGGVCPDKPEPYSSWAQKKDVQVEYIGEAKEGLSRGVVCASFNAG